MVYSMTAASSGASVRPTNYSASNLPITDLGAPTDNTDAATKKYVDDQVSGMVTDVQVNGTSVLTNGVANIPVAGYSKAAMGAIWTTGTWGLAINQSEQYKGAIAINLATDAQIKNGVSGSNPLSANKQHQAAFYGLAKAAGDITQSQSSNAVGTYTPEAKAAIQNMLGISQTGLSVVNGQLCITYEEVSA